MQLTFFQPPGSAKDEETIKRLRHYLTKCGIHFFSYKNKLSDCKNAKQEIEVLKNQLKEVGIEGIPSLEKCAAIKKKLDLQREVQGLDTSLIIGGGRPTRQRAAARPTYAVDISSEEEESSSAEDDEEDDEEEEEEDEEEEGENKNEEESNEKDEPAPKKKAVRKAKIESDDDVEEFEDDDISNDEYEVIDNN